VKNWNLAAVERTCQIDASYGPTMYWSINKDSVVFSKAYDESGKVTELRKMQYGTRFPRPTTFFIEYRGLQVYFWDEEKTDTMIVATFDPENRLIHMSVVRNVERTDDVSFTYENNRLVMFIEGGFNPVYISYNQNGNVTRMQEDTTTNDEGTFFTYDLSFKAKNQWYPDTYFAESYRKPVDMLYLAQFMGWLPELMPVHKRIAAKSVMRYDYGETPEYMVLQDARLIDHVYDREGNLVSYKVDGRNFTYRNVWRCRAVN
jgi:hypothetical protein